MKLQWIRLGRDANIKFGIQRLVASLDGGGAEE